MNFHLTSEEIGKYIMKLQTEYQGIASYEKDLLFASHICSTVVNMVLNEVVLNQKLKEHIALVI